MGKSDLPFRLRYNSHMPLIKITERLVDSLRPLAFGAPIAYVYNPLEYAREPHRLYLERFGGAPKEIVLLGMNPGPFGMAQTGVPFGDVSMVRDWMGIRAAVGHPASEHPKRPVQGFDCPRSEVSGTRLWGWARDRFDRPDRFFARFFVINYCPLCFMEASGRNFTPDKLPASECEALMACCDEAFRQMIEHLGPRRVIGVGQYAEDRARVALEGLDVSIGRILHPSPASPAANRGWAEAAEKALGMQGVTLPCET